MTITFIGYHCSPIADAQFAASVERSLCLADEKGAAESYCRGEGTHYVYEIEARGRIMSASKFGEMLEEMGLGRYVEDGEEYEAAKLPIVRNEAVERGYDGVRYGDTNGFDYLCCELFDSAAIVRVEMVEAIES